MSNTIDYFCPDCHLNVIFALSTCSVTGKYHANKPVQIQHIPFEGPAYTIDDPDLDDLLNETHWMSVGLSQGISSMDESLIWMEALERVLARLAKVPPLKRMEYDDAKVVHSVREIEEGSFQYPVKVIVAYTLAGAFSNVALNKDELLRLVATGLDASPTAEVSLIEGYTE